MMITPQNRNELILTIRVCSRRYHYMKIHRTTQFKYGSLLAGITLLLTACGEAPQQGQGGMPPSLVTVQSVEANSASYKIQLPARVQGSREVEVSARSEERRVGKECGSKGAATHSTDTETVKK